MRLKDCMPWAVVARLARIILGAGSVFGIALGAAGLCPAIAQTSPGSNYHTQTMNYDLWCQQQAGLPAERCDKRLPQDVKTFEAYRAKVERYEIPYLQRKDEEAHINRMLLHNDPIDNPSTGNLPH